jgi:hypothetical protein
MIWTWTSLSLAGTLSGQVITWEGEPLQGVTVAAYDSRLAGVGTLTDELGRFSIEVEPGRYRLRAYPEHLAQVERFWPAAWRFCDGTVLEIEGDEELGDLDFRLPEGGSLSGRLVDDLGEPVGGIEISCRGTDTRGSQVRRGASTDAGGLFVVRGLDSDPTRDQPYLCQLTGDSVPDQYPGGTTSSTEGQTWAARVGVTRDLGSLPLLSGGSVEGLLDSELGPVQGASVHLYSSSQVRTVESDVDGHYLARGLPAGDVIGWASLEGWSMTYYPDAAVPEESEPLEEGGALVDYDIWMPLEATLRGQLLPADQDLSGVTLLAWNETFRVGIGAQAEADGSFEVRRLHPGPHALFLYAEPEGFRQDFARDGQGEVAWFEASVEPLDPVEVALEPGAWLEGRVLDDAGEPVYGATLSLVPVDEDLDSEVAVTDREGQWSMDGLPPGAFRLSASLGPYCPEDPGYVTTHWPGTHDARALEPLTVEGASVRGGLDLVMPRDDDHDGMSDAWERRWGLDAERDDAAADPDLDGASNLSEYMDGTNPREDLLGGCGCGGGAGGLAPALLGLLFSRRRARPGPRTRAPRARRTCAGSS